MDLNQTFRSAYDALVSKPSSILPFYFMSVSVPAVARVAPILTGVFVYLALLRRGHIEEIQEVIDTIPFDEFQEEDPAAFEEVEGVETALRELSELIFVPEVIAVVVASVVVFALLLIVLNAAVSAGQINAIYSVLTDDMGADASEEADDSRFDDALTDGGESSVDHLGRGVEGVFEDTVTFALLRLLEVFLILAVTGALLLAGTVLLSGGGALAVAVGALLVLVWLLAVLIIHVFFIFAPQSVVIDENGVFGAIRGNLDFVSENAVEFIAYLIFVLAAVIALASVSGFFNVLGAPAATVLVTYLVFAPYIGAVKTDLYARHAGDEVDVPDASVDSGRVASAFRRGWDEMVAFTVSRFGLVVVSSVLFAVSAVAAWEVTQSAEVGFETSIADRLEQTALFGEFVNYTANNWSVAVAQSYAGFVFGVATVVSLVVNGALLGFLAATEQNLAELLAFVVPHGVIEIPALLISGALGLHLGLVAVGYVRGGVDTEGVTAEVREAYYVLVGLFVLFAVAGFVEAFISPYYYGPLLGI